MKIKFTRVVSSLIAMMFFYSIASAQNVPPPSLNRWQKFGVFQWSYYPCSSNTPDGLNWGVNRANAFGSDVIRVALDAGDRYKVFGSPWTEDLADMINPNVSGNWAWHNLFNNPQYRVYLLSVNTRNLNPWLDGFAPDSEEEGTEYKIEKNEIKKLGAYLLSTFSTKTFIILNWEGDHAFDDYSYGSASNGGGFYFQDGQPLSSNNNDPGLRQYSRAIDSIKPLDNAGGDYLYGDISFDAIDPPSKVDLWWLDENEQWHLAHYPVESNWAGKRIWLQTLADNLGLKNKKVRLLEFAVYDGKATLHSAGPRRYLNRWQDLTNWINARAQGVQEARSNFSTGEEGDPHHLYSGLEFYQTYSRSPNGQYYRYASGPKQGQLIRTGEADNMPSEPPDPEYPNKYNSVINYVAPRVNVDYYSFSPYETLAIRTPGNELYDPTTTLKSAFKTTLDFAKNKIRNTEHEVPEQDVGLNRNMVGEANFIIGEWFYGTQPLINEFITAFEGSGAFKPSYFIFYEYSYLFANLSDNTQNAIGQAYNQAINPNPPPVTAASVSSASFTAPVARESLATAYSLNLATVTLEGSDIDPNTPGIQLPTSLGGTTVQVRDSAGVVRLAPLLYVSAPQVNYQIPANTALGTATITITNGNGNVTTGTVQVTTLAPGIFLAGTLPNTNCQGLAAGTWRRYNSAGQLVEPDHALSDEINFGADGDIVYIILYGTGIRFRSSLAAVTAIVGGQAATVEYAGAQGYVGLDQLNIRLPRTLIGSGLVKVQLAADGLAANAVTVKIK